VHGGDIRRAADHVEDIAMLDATAAGVRGIDAYRETWKASSPAGVGCLVRRAVVGGGRKEDVAFAYALLRCGTADQIPTYQDHVRTRRRAALWSHTSTLFPDRSDPADADADADVRAVPEGRSRRPGRRPPTRP
jgi:ketosteroid isomerase-like protein